MQGQIQSRHRVRDHGEVFTNMREVNAMLDLVSRETLRPDSRFLEPACGTGNFLKEVLRRKLDAIAAKYKKSRAEYEFWSVIGIASLYGIDVQADNIFACRENLYKLFEAAYSGCYGRNCRKSCCDAVRFILENNIVCGDSLTMRFLPQNIRADELSAYLKNPAARRAEKPISFPEWSPLQDSFIKRRDFIFKWNEREKIFIREETAHYKAAHFLAVAGVEKLEAGPIPMNYATQKLFAF